MPELELVFSNTTEVGIAHDPGDGPALRPPRSFPGKLAAFLAERARAFDYDPARGVAVVPCELVERNGERLREIVLALAPRWEPGGRLADWIAAAVPFCNTLVDRIVPGAPTGDDAVALRATLGYDDALLTVCEPYALFAIEPRGATERKLRLLNGAHTASVSAALLAGCTTVRDAVADDVVGPFVRRALLDEILPTVDAPDAAPFAREVLDRFANPFVRHALFDITLQGTAKLRVRLVPPIVAFGRRTGRAPAALALGFAAHLAFMRGDLHAARRAAGLPVPPDDEGERVRALWTAPSADGPDDDARASRVARTACADAALWGADLAAVPGFADAVAAQLARILRDGVRAALATLAADAAARPAGAAP
jgi:tagaturonate reductase